MISVVMCLGLESLVTHESVLDVQQSKQLVDSIINDVNLSDNDMKGGLAGSYDFILHWLVDISFT